MAEELVFESEKELARRRKRRTLIIIIAAAAALAAAAAIFWLVSRTSRTHTGGDELPYRYAWKQSADGSAVLSVDREGDLVWRITDDGEEFGTVGIKAAGVKGQSSEFRLTPIDEGRAMMKLILGNKEDDEGDKCSMELLTEAFFEHGRLCCRVLSASCKSIRTESGDSAAFPYRIYNDNDGDIIVEIPTGEEDWECVSSNEETAEVIGIINGEETVTVYIRPGGLAGSAEVVMTSSFEGKQLKILLTLSEDGEFVFSQDAASTFEPTVTPAPDGTFSPDALLTPTPEP